MALLLSLLFKIDILGEVEDWVIAGFDGNDDETVKVGVLLVEMGDVLRVFCELIKDLGAEFGAAFGGGGSCL